MTTNSQRIKASAAILQLHIDLRGTNPKIWRRVLVPETITLAKLHLVIQAAFGWSRSHLHEFIGNDGQRYGTPDPRGSRGTMASERVRLTAALRTRKTLTYVYDFGDYWEHRIIVEKRRAPGVKTKLPLCMSGAGATPPENCGGVSGYEDVVRAMADPNHAEHESMVEWIGSATWDPTAFDTAQVNSWFSEIRL